ncbi:MAG: prephenate dehydrogenase [Chloroflexota bacterium]
MAELSIATVGLGRIGTSVGLALKRYNERPDSQNHFNVIGTDRIGEAERTAKKMGAIDSAEASIRNAVQDKDLVVVAAPYAEVRDIFKDMAPGLRDGAVVFDLSTLKGPSLEWAAKFLPDGTHIVGGTAVVNPVYLWDGLDDTEHAQADYFDGGSMILAPSASANAEAIELVTTFSKLLGADVHFMDPVEHDGLIAATEGIPAVLSVAAFRALAASDGWGEIQRLTNPAFGRMTHRLMDTHPDDVRDMLIHNRENTVRYIDSVIVALGALRDVLADNDRDAVEAAVVDAADRYERWIRQRSQGKWDQMIDEDRSAGATMLSGMLGGFLADRLLGRNNRNDDE